MAVHLTQEGCLRTWSGEDTKTEETELVTSFEEWRATASAWPLKRLVALWNALPGVLPVRKFTSRDIALERIWRFLHPSEQTTPRKQKELKNPFREGSRPHFETDEKQRSLVKSLAMLGLQQEQICQVVGIRSPKTSRKHFRSELTHGGLHGMAKVMQTAYEMATAGRYPAMTMFWEKCQRDAQAEREHEQLEKERLEAWL